jgi:hypothetical protein
MAPHLNPSSGVSGTGPQPLPAVRRHEAPVSESPHGFHRQSLSALTLETFETSPSERTTPFPCVGWPHSRPETQLRRLPGSYESKSPPLDVVIESLGERLTVSIGGATPGPLTAVSPTRLLIGKTPAPGTEEFPRIDLELDGDQVVKFVLKQDAVQMELRPKGR